MAACFGTATGSQDKLSFSMLLFVVSRASYKAPCHKHKGDSDYSDFNFGPFYIVIGACSTTHHNSLLRVRFVRTSCNNDGKDPSLKHLGCIKTKQNAAVHLGNF